VIRKLRLATGLVLFAYVTLHLVNHVAGLWSLPVMDAVRGAMRALWWSIPGTVILYGSLAVHGILALYGLYLRRRLMLSFNEGLQVVLGLAIPLLLLGHVMDTRVAATFFDMQVDYLTTVLAQWHVDPMTGLRQLAALFAVWIHGCLGLYNWLFLKPWFARWRLTLFAFALLIPTLALTSWLDITRQALALNVDPAWFEAFKARVQWPGAAEGAAVERLMNIFTFGFLGVLVLTLGLRFLRTYWERWRGIVRLTYDGGKIVQFPHGHSILEASRTAVIPHASVCGGRGRCSTCRVRIIRGAENLPPASAAEQKVLDRVKAGAQVRLACQTRPRGGEVEVMRLLPASAEAADGFARPGYYQGQELEIAILFADLRAFTKLSEKKLPYDVVFLLNRYFDAMGTAITQCGGHLDKFIGDGVMALFGIEDGPEAGCRAALAAARQMGLRLEELNRALVHDLDDPLRIGIGIHCGPAIVGMMGYGAATTITAIGDSVNTASRLETQTKEYGAQLVVSQTTVARAGVDLSAFEQHDVLIRGRTEPMKVHVIALSRDLPA
jgi:adenylate cyclase